LSMNQSEAISTLTTLVVHLYRRDGLARRLRATAFGSTDSMGKLAKMCGTTPEVVAAWETGSLEPTTTEAMRWLTVLHAHDAYGFKQKSGT